MIFRHLIIPITYIFSFINYSPVNQLFVPLPFFIPKVEFSFPKLFKTFKPFKRRTRNTERGTRNTITVRNMHPVRVCDKNVF